MPFSDAFPVSPRYWDGSRFRRQNGPRGGPETRRRRSDCPSDGTTVDAEADRPGTGVSGPVGDPTEHLERQRGRPGLAGSRLVPDRSAQQVEYRRAVPSSFHPRPVDVHKQVPNCRQQMTWATDRGGNPVGIEAMVPGSDFELSVTARNPEGS